MIVVGGEYGQLGNRLVVFANMVACACAHGVRVANPAFHPYARYFVGTRHDPLCRFPPARPARLAGTRFARFMNSGAALAARYAQKLHRRTGRWPPLLRVLDIGWFEPCNLDGPAFLSLARRPGILITRGWLFRARQSFQQHIDTIRRFFTPTPPYRQNALALPAALRKTCEVVVGVHIRQGDYKAFAGGRYYFHTGQYVALMRRTAQLLHDRRLTFLACSNVPQPADAFDGLPVTFGTGQVVEDLYALSACDYLIGPPSTFTQWASFYGGVPLYTVSDPGAPFDLRAFRVLAGVS